jgi:hypothetical protein
MARGGARLGAGRPAGKSANTSTVSARARARARVGGGNQRPWPADKVERWPVDRLCVHQIEMSPFLPFSQPEVDTAADFDAIVIGAGVSGLYQLYKPSCPDVSRCSMACVAPEAASTAILRPSLAIIMASFSPVSTR